MQGFGQTDIIPEGNFNGVCTIQAREARFQKSKFSKGGNGRSIVKAKGTAGSKMYNEERARHAQNQEQSGQGKVRCLVSTDHLTPMGVLGIWGCNLVCDWIKDAQLLPGESRLKTLVVLQCVGQSYRRKSFLPCSQLWRKIHQALRKMSHNNLN